MVKKYGEFFKLVFSILLLTCAKCSEIEPNELDLVSFDFEQIKYDFFTSNKTHLLSNRKFTLNDVECLAELIKIGKGLKNMSQGIWALKLLDAWGKIPSTLLSGNFYEFGGFSECFHIERNNEPYKTQYCLGQLSIDLEGMLAPKSYQYEKYDASNFFLPDILPFKNKPQISSRILVPPSQNGLSVVFGLCMPATCSVDIMRKFFNHKITKSVSMQLVEKSCQLEENASELRTIDWVTIEILAVILILIVISTSYDLLCTVYNREKTQALLAFSFYSNGIKLLSYKEVKSPDMMNCLHGIRVLSTQWVVLGHTYLMYFYLPIRNKIAVPTFVSQYHNMFILSALISVDTFFVLSGLLVSINILKHLEKTKGKINIPLLYFHRYLRLTPFLAISILFSMTLLRFLGNGPLWASTVDHLGQQCERHWWSTLLYVQNYVNPSDLCFAHSWYLSVDMQLFLISPFIVYLIYYFNKKAIVVMVALVLGCMWCTIAVHEKYGFTTIFTKNKMAVAYVPTHIRFSPWLIGVIAGYIFVKTRNTRVRIPRLFNLFAWLLSLATMATVVFANYPFQQLDSKNKPLEFGIYDAVTRVSWAIALCYIIFACVHGSGGPINWFLAHPLWQPISRLCFATYLLHFPIVVLMMATLKTSPFFTELTAFHTFIGNYMLTIFVAIIATLAFESPIVVIEKIMFGPKKRRESINENDSNEVQRNDTEIKRDDTRA